jgi:hypothetical protein
MEQMTTFLIYQGYTVNFNHTIKMPTHIKGLLNEKTSSNWIYLV